MSLARNGFIVDPTYLGQTAEEHVQFIKKQESYENQYIYINNLKEKATIELQNLTDKADQSITSICKALDLNRKAFQKSVIDIYTRDFASKELETLFLTIQGELYMRTATNTDNSGLIQFVDKLYLLLESYESTPELCTKYEEYYSLFPKEKFDTEIQSIRKHVIELQKLCQDSENTLETLNDIVLLIDEYPKKADDEIYIVSDALLEILSNNNDRWNFKEYKFFQKYLIEAVKLKIFLRDLKLHSPFLKDQALIYSDIMLGSAKLNWIGVQGDCAKLVNFLIDNKPTINTKVEP